MEAADRTVLGQMHELEARQRRQTRLTAASVDRA